MSRRKKVQSDLTVLGFLKSLRPLEDDQNKKIRLNISRDGIHIAVQIIGHLCMDDLPECSARFIEEEKPEVFGPNFIGHDMRGNTCEKTAFVFRDDGSLNKDGMPIKWREAIK